MYDSMDNLINQLEENEMTNIFGGEWILETIRGIEYIIYIVD